MVWNLPEDFLELCVLLQQLVGRLKVLSSVIIVRCNIYDFLCLDRFYVRRLLLGGWVCGRHHCRRIDSKGHWHMWYHIMSIWHGRHCHGRCSIGIRNWWHWHAHHGGDVVTRRRLYHCRGRRRHAFDFCVGHSSWEHLVGSRHLGTNLLSRSIFVFFTAIIQDFNHILSRRGVLFGPTKDWRWSHTFRTTHW